jgi:hypothetical protein
VPNRRSQTEGGGFFAFDLGSLMGREGSKSPKYPKEMLKVLDDKLKRISMGQETKWVTCCASPGWL